MTSMSDINVTPMVDVMLVLLVIFILAAPLLNHAIRLDLPQAQTLALPQDVKTITLSFDGSGKLFWDTELSTIEDVGQRLALSAKQKPQPEILLRADKSTRFELIAEVMAVAQSQGLSKIGFATEPKTSAASATSAKSSAKIPVNSPKK